VLWQMIIPLDIDEDLLAELVTTAKAYGISLQDAAIKALALGLMEDWDDTDTYYGDE